MSNVVLLWANHLDRAVAAVAVLALACSAPPAIVPLAASESSKAEAAAPSSSRGASTEWVQDTYAKLPLSFEANVGQTDPQVDFLARGSGYTMFLSQGDAVLSFRSGTKSGRQMPGHPEAVAAPLIGGVLRMQLGGANAVARVSPERRLGGTVNYFIGNDPTGWRTNVPTYARVVYHDAYPGIDLAYYGDQGRLEYDFVVAPGADPSAIALRFAGAESVMVDGLGDLVLGLAAGEIRQQKPLIYQKAGGVRTAISGGYLIADNGEVRFAVAAYDSSRPLVIDPVLVYSTYLGGANGDIGLGIAVDTAGSAYVTGQTRSTDFPTSTGAHDTTLTGTVDIFVTKLNAAGTGLIYSTYLGGSGSLDESSSAIAVDTTGSAYITGFTGSSDFPTTSGAFDTTNGPPPDAFVTKLNAAGTGLLYSTYLGGDGQDNGRGIAVDSAGSAYVTGDTASTDFPTSAGAFATTLDGISDAFVTKLNAAGSGLAYSTYLGGGDREIGFDIAVDTAGSAYVTGSTWSTDFPTSAGAFDTTLSGAGDTADAFVTKLNPAGTGFLYSTYLGGGSHEEGDAIAIDSLGSVYIAGITSSTDFPTSGGAVDTMLGGPQDAFVTKLNTAGSGLVYSTYLGGSGFDSGFGIAVDTAGSAHVTGNTTSADFPTTSGAFDTMLNGFTDAFVTKLNSAGTGLLYSTYLGGGGNEVSRAIAIDTAGSIYVTGQTTSTNFPTTAFASQTAPPGGGGDAFVTKIIPIGAPTTLTLSPATATNPVETSHTVTATVTDVAGQPVPDIVVRFTVTGAVNTSGMCTTAANGQCSFTYTGPSLPGADAITAFADTNGDGDQDVGEPSGGATKTWTVPPSTALCEVKVTNGGQITALNGDKANFGGVAKSEEGNLSGSENYQDHGPAQPLHMKSTKITAVTCSLDRVSAEVFGEATIDGAGSFTFRIRVTDNGESGRNDVYGIILSNGYASGDKVLEGGNVQIH
jgi:beta-propeller repeat-containing protein